MNSEKKSTEIVGVILAGGNARRLGVALKANISVGGVSLLRRVFNAINQDCGHLILSIGQHAFRDYDVLGDMVPVGDKGTGPAAALVASSQFAAQSFPKSQYLLSVAVDTPFFPTDFAERALNLLTPEVDVVVAGFNGQAYPTNALWRISAFASSCGKSGDDNPPRALFGLLDERRWKILDYADLGGENPFSNINTPAELLASNRRDAAKRN